MTVLDAIAHGQYPLLEYCLNTNFDFVKGDIYDELLMPSLISKHDVIIPLAAIVGTPACKTNPLLTKLVNYDDQMMLIRKISQSQRIIFPTTNSGYGIGEKDNFCTEESPLKPLSDY